MLGNIVLFSWPIVVLVLFKRTSKTTALLASLLGGYLLLPERIAFDLPLLPPLNKHTVPTATAFFILLSMNRDHDRSVLPGWLPRSRTVQVGLLMLVIGAYFTIHNNSDVLIYGPTILPALAPYDAFSLILSILTTILPFFLARKFLAYPDQLRAVLTALIISGFCYSFLALYEVRMSPQLHNIFYGFYQHSFLQHVRGDGGFRPMVFLNHGLWVSIFFALSVLAAVGMIRLAPAAERAKYIFFAIWLFVTLFLTKSLGAFTITCLLLPIIFLGRRFQLAVATVVAIVVMLYPILRGAGYIPLEQIMEWANGVDPARAFSLQYRLENEEILLAKAQERPLFGWGIWGRSLIYSEWSGAVTSVTDGYWVIVIGVGGWIKYLAEFGLLCLVLIYLFLKKRSYDLGPETSILALILSANLLDLLPNATVTPVTWMLAGCLWGRLELGRITQDEPTQETVSTRHAQPRYSRFGDPRPVSRQSTKEIHN